MTVETATYISDLNSALPNAADNLSEGDDHLRLIKATLGATFSGFAGAAMTATEAELNKLAGIGSGDLVTGSTATGSPNIALGLLEDRNTTPTSGTLALNMATAGLFTRYCNGAVVLSFSNRRAGLFPVLLRNTTAGSLGVTISGFATTYQYDLTGTAANSIQASTTNLFIACINDRAGGGNVFLVKAAVWTPAP